MELSVFIRQYRKSNGLTMQKFADRAGLTKGFISQIENDFRNNKGNKKMMPSLATLKKLAIACEMSISEFLNIIDTDISLADDEPVRIHRPSPESVRTIPVYGEISCGNGLFIEDNIEDYITVPTTMLPIKSAEYFAQYASGDSMIGAGINPGDMIIFRKTSQIENGQIGCFCINENVATCKKFTRSGESILLLPMNDKYDPIVVDINYECFRVVGVKTLKLGE